MFGAINHFPYFLDTAAFDLNRESPVEDIVPWDNCGPNKM